MEEEKRGISRRDFMKTTGLATGALVGGGLLGSLIGYNMKTDRAKIDEPTPSNEATNADVRGLMFFKRRIDFDVLSAAVERIFPEDDLGPGAIGLAVPYFIDNQLAGSYGSNAREYMQGPFFEGEATQGYQSRLTRAEIFLQGIQKLNEEAQSRFKKPFNEITDEEMDVILTDCQNNKIPMKGVTSAFFFKLLRQATLEGAYADPIYSGNRKMDGWRMKGFPGHQMAYIQVIEEKAFQQIEPQSIRAMQP